MLRFKIDLFIEWLMNNGSSQTEIDRLLERKDWGRYDGMTYEEVKLEERITLRQWFKEEA